MKDGPFAFRNIRFFKPGETDSVLERVAKAARIQ